MAGEIRAQVIEAAVAALNTLPDVTVLQTPTYEVAVKTDPPSIAVYAGGHDPSYPANGVARYAMRLDLVLLERARGQSDHAEIGPALDRQLAARHADIIRALNAHAGLWALITDLRETAAGDPEPISDQGIAPVVEWPIAVILEFETAAHDPAVAP